MIRASAVIAAASVAFAVVVGVLAWIATHPGQGRGQVSTLPLAPLPSPAIAEDEPPAPPPAPRPIVTIPAVHRPERPEVTVNHIPKDEEAPPLPLPPLPAPTCAPQPPVAAAQPAPPAGETYGTQVLFLNNPAAAREAAQHEKKLLFVMHISGNFEDSCFT
ncbi:MAG TPA: hypothetical protein VH643_11485 [Gemmataceae bacterium]